MATTEITLSVVQRAWFRKAMGCGVPGLFVAWLALKFLPFGASMVLKVGND